MRAKTPVSDPREAGQVAPASTHRARLDRLRGLMEERGLDGLLVSQPESRFYLSGYTGHDLPPRDSAGYLLVTPARALLFTDPRTAEQAGHEAPDFELVTYQTGVFAPGSIAEQARKLGIGRLGFEAAHLPYATWDSVAGALASSGPTLEKTDGLVDELRVVKDAVELRQVQRAVDVLDACFAHLRGWLEPGLSERRVAREIEHYLVEHADGPAFPPIVASGPNGSMPHAVATDRRFEAGDAVTLDIGARVDGYCSDMTRTLCVGEPPDAQLREIHAIVLEAQARAQRDIRPGMTGKEADALAREVIAGAGYGEAFTHSLGHGIGLEVHEPPWVSHLRGDAVLRAGMVFSLEPGVYLPGWGGVRVEDLVVLEPNGPRVLGCAPRDMALATAH